MNNIAHLKQYLFKSLPGNYAVFLDSVQERYDASSWELNQGNLNVTDRKEKILNFIRQELEQHEIDLNGYTMLELMNKVYDDIARYSILTKPLVDQNVVKVIISSWRMVKLIFFDGTSIDIGGFVSAKQAKTILQRLLRETDIICDETSTIDYYSPNNTHMVAVLPPLVDDDTALFVSITKQNKRDIDNESNKLNFIQFCIEHGISTLFISDDENAVQPFLNSIIESVSKTQQVVVLNDHTVLQQNQANNIVYVSSDTNIVHILKLAPMVLVTDEIVPAYELSSAGQTVITAIQGKTIKQGHNQIATEITQKRDIDFNVALRNTCDSFPLIVYVKTLSDGVQRVINISECYVEESVKYKTLYEFEIDENTVEMGKMSVTGSLKQVSNVSENLISLLKLYGATSKEIEALEKGCDM